MLAQQQMTATWSILRNGFWTQFSISWWIGQECGQEDWMTSYKLTDNLLNSWEVRSFTMLTSNRGQSFHVSCSERSAQICNQLLTRLQIRNEGSRENRSNSPLLFDGRMWRMPAVYIFVSQIFGEGCYSSHDKQVVWRMVVVVVVDFRRELWLWLTFGGPSYDWLLAGLVVVVYFRRVSCL